MSSVCAVFLCNKAYFNKFLHTCSLLVTRGNYHGDICLVIGDDLKDSPLLNHALITKHNILIKHFPDISFDDTFLTIQRMMPRAPHWYAKLFQYHKLHLFNTFFKRWEYIFYIDCGITIFSDIAPMLAEKTENTLLAHSDAYPTYEWKLHNQFSKESSHFSRLATTFNLNIDYCQTTIMLYHTAIIEEDTFHNLLQLATDYPISITNDQGIIALYFTNIKPYFKQIKTHNDVTHFYDYLSRNKSFKYIMLKAC